VYLIDGWLIKLNYFDEREWYGLREIYIKSLNSKTRNKLIRYNIWKERNNGNLECHLKRMLEDTFELTIH